MDDIITHIVKLLRKGETIDAKQLSKIINQFNRELPKNKRSYAKKQLLPYYFKVKNDDKPQWRQWAITPDIELKLIETLKVKPRRSASGVATITVITKPWPCASNCIYCPNDLRMPKSYLSDEPACQRAERNFFDPYLQVTSRLRALNQMGHVTDKVELIVLGGTWSDYPLDYQRWFIRELFRALNDAKSKDQAVHARKLRTFYKNQGLSSDVEARKEYVSNLQQQVEAGSTSYNQAVKQLYGSDSPWDLVSSKQRATQAELELEHKRNEEATHRVVGLVIETRPDLITPENLIALRSFGCTKIQMGIQSLRPEILELNHRHLSIEDIKQAFSLARLFGFKIHAHFMVNLVGSTPKEDIEDFRRFVTETPYQPDEIKLYPCALIHGTKLCDFFEDGSWLPYDETTLVSVLVQDMLNTPEFTRISRMIRDFSAHDIVAGNKKVNLRQLVEAQAERLIEQSQTKQSQIREIRHREIATGSAEVDKLSYSVTSYQTLTTKEYFLQWVTPENKIAGFLRLSLPLQKSIAKLAATPGFPLQEDEAMIREVHIYGKVAGLHQVSGGAQHLGLGRQLIEYACSIARDAGYTKMNVISSVGTRAYYRKLGFLDNGLYQQKVLR